MRPFWDPFDFDNIKLLSFSIQFFSGDFYVYHHHNITPSVLPSRAPPHFQQLWKVRYNETCTSCTSLRYILRYIVRYILPSGSKNIKNINMVKVILQKILKIFTNIWKVGYNKTCTLSTLFGYILGYKTGYNMRRC